MLSELLEGGAEAFGVGHDFRGVHHKGHTVDLFIQAWPLHIAHSLRPHWLIWAKLGERNDECFKKNNSCYMLAFQHFIINTKHKVQLRLMSLVSVRG